MRHKDTDEKISLVHLACFALSTFQGALDVPFDIMSSYKSILKLHIAITPGVHQQLSPFHRYSSSLAIPLWEYLQDGGGLCLLIRVELAMCIGKSQSTGKSLERN